MVSSSKKTIFKECSFLKNIFKAYLFLKSFFKKNKEFWLDLEKIYIWKIQGERNFDP